MSRGARLLRSLLGVYRAWSAGRPPRCRYLPTCSAYAEEAVVAHGAVRGTWLAVRRVGRCRPGGGFGYDPVPEPSGTEARGIEARGIEARGTDAREAEPSHPEGRDGSGSSDGDPRRERARVG